MSTEDYDDEQLYRIGKYMLKIGCFALCIILILNIFFVFGYVPSNSMEPTINSGQRIIGSRLHYKLKDLQRGDIIMFKHGDGDYMVKRVIGLPGEHVQVKENSVCIDSKELKEDYLNKNLNNEIVGEYDIPKDSYFVLGDNRDNSKDSRVWETKRYVKKKSIVAYVLYVI